MQRCIELAAIAESEGEVPVGAVVVHQGEIIAEGYNQPISKHDPSAHAEMIALRKAATHFENYRLPSSARMRRLHIQAKAAGFHHCPASTA